MAECMDGLPSGLVLSSALLFSIRFGGSTVYCHGYCHERHPEQDSVA